MPPAPVRRQPDTPSDAWFHLATTRRLVQEVQRQATPELTRVFGHGGLFLRPSSQVPAQLSGNMLAHVVSLHRQGEELSGDLNCRDDRLPIASASLSLVYSLFVFETSPDPAALLAELARVLKPGGAALFLSLNRWGLARARWGFKGLRSHGAAEFAQQVGEAGLEVSRQRYLGPVWSVDDSVSLDEPRHGGLGSHLRMANLLVARRRDPGVTPLRVASPALKLRPGMSAG
jgi:SAM-dependent methyltransferase